uniref:Neurotransmitter-gated ion-channel ligand-binding domain-containing protein n=1 Tax=Strigamia maritima TaxID=126957 RepID=T1IP39_STRMM
MDCYFRQSWTDSRLQFEGPVNQLSLSIQVLDGIWKPDTFFHNGHKSHIHTMTVPNKLLRIKQNGEVLYSVRLTIKASCPMQLHKFPMDIQSCPLILGSSILVAYSKEDLIFVWGPVDLHKSMLLSQFDLIGEPQLKNFNSSISQKGVEFSMLQVNFTLQRHMGYFLLQIYFPCILIVVLSWVSFWINREATADRIGLGITTVLTLSTFVLDTRNDLPKVHYPTALDWFVLMCFSFVIATLLEFAGVHYFTKIGSGEHMESDLWEDIDLDEDIGLISTSNVDISYSITEMQKSDEMETEPETESNVMKKRSVAVQTYHVFSFWKQFCLCLSADEEYRQRNLDRRPRNNTDVMNSVSEIDRTSRILFPLVFTLLNLIYWFAFTLQTKP